MQGSSSTILIVTFTIAIIVLFFFSVFFVQPGEFTLTSAQTSSMVNSLINSLRTYGIKADQAIERANTSSFLLNADSILEVRANGVTLIIYEYTNDTLKGIDASLLSPDGSTYTAKGQVIVEDYAAQQDYTLLQRTKHYPKVCRK